MLEKILGISGVLAFFSGTHWAMRSYYKKYRYWWNYYCDLGLTKPENRRSVVLFTASTIYFAFTMVVFWANIDHYLHENLRLIQITGIVGAISFIGIVLFPYDKAHFTHSAFLFLASIQSCAALYIANKEMGFWPITLLVVGMGVYLAVVAVTTIVFRNNMRGAHRYHAPIQKIYMLIMEGTIIAVLIKI